MARDHPSRSGREPDSVRQYDQYDVTLKVEPVDGTDNHKYNAVPWPLRTLAATMMKKQGAKPVADYDVVLTGTDADYMVDHMIRGFEVEIRDKQTGNRHIERATVTPREFTRDRGQFTVRNPVPPDELAAADWTWPDENYQLMIRPLDIDDTYIY